MAFPPSQGSAMIKHLNLATLSASLAAAFALTACGGGGGSGTPAGSSSSFAPVNVSIAAPTGTGTYGAGNAITLMGTANTPNTTIKTMAWSVSPLATLNNADCAGAVKNNQSYSTNNQGITGTSNWTCPVNITTPSGGATDTVYMLTLTATDEKGNSQSATQKVTVAPSPSGGNSASNGLTANAGSNFTAASGSANPLHCSATSGKAPYTYQWTVTSNGGFNVPLANYTTPDTSFVAPITNIPTVLSFNCLVTDGSNFTASSIVSASINSVVVTPLAANAGNSFTALVGSTNSLHCDATGGKAPYTYQWVISNNGGYNFPLSSYSASDTSFTAPAVTAASTMSFTCRSTDATNTTATSTVSAVVNPATASANTLVANILQPGTASPGQTITLDGSSTGWFDASTGKTTTGPVPTFAWTSTDASVVIANPTAAKTTATIPSSITVPTTESFTLTATSGTKTSSSSVNVLVDPFGPLSLTVSPSALAAKGNVASTFVASATSPSGSANIYYQWTQLTGTSLTLGGANTATLGVVPPVVGAGSTATYTFRVAVGYKPITGAYPGLYFADVTLTVTP